MTDIDFPYHFDNKGRTASAGQDDHIREMIEQFIFTNPGERVNRPDFGSGLLQMVFAPNSSELASALKYTIQAGLLKYLGDLIEIRALDVEGVDAEIRVSIQYSVRSSGEQHTETFTRRCP
jgi:phage baseplate assembly protein W